MNIGTLVLLLQVFFGILTIAGIWATLDKAGEEGFAAMVPFYGAFCLLRVAGLSGWLFPVLLVPYLNLLFFPVVGFLVGRRFGKPVAFCVGLGLLPMIFFPILGLGASTFDPHRALRSPTPVRAF